MVSSQSSLHSSASPSSSLSSAAFPSVAALSSARRPRRLSLLMPAAVVVAAMTLFIGTFGASASPLLLAQHHQPAAQNQQVQRADEAVLPFAQFSGSTPQLVVFPAEFPLERPADEENAAANDGENAEEMGAEEEYGEAKPKRAQTFVRFGKRAQMFVRFGKRAQMFVRFGRDAQRQQQLKQNSEGQQQKQRK